MVTKEQIKVIMDEIDNILDEHGEEIEKARKIQKPSNEWYHKLEEKTTEFYSLSKKMASDGEPDFFTKKAEEVYNEFINNKDLKKSIQSLPLIDNVYDEIMLLRYIKNIMDNENKVGFFTKNAIDYGLPHIIMERGYLKYMAGLK